MVSSLVVVSWWLPRWSGASYQIECLISLETNHNFNSKTVFNSRSIEHRALPIRTKVEGDGVESEPGRHVLLFLWGRKSNQPSIRLRVFISVVNWLRLLLRFIWVLDASPWSWGRLLPRVQRHSAEDWASFWLISCSTTTVCHMSQWLFAGRPYDNSTSCLFCFCYWGVIELELGPK